MNTSRATELSLQIKKDILEKGLSKGDFYMTEEQLIQQHEVSRSIAREAISRLRGIGLLKSRQKKGLFIDQPDPIQLWSISMPFWGKMTKDYNNLIQLRYCIELGAIDIAVHQATEEEINQLIKLAQLFEKHIKNKKQRKEIEYKFHKLLLEMTHNPFISQTHEVLLEYFSYSKFEHYAYSLNDTLTVYHHHALAESIRQRDSEQAKIFMKQHLNSLLQTTTNTTESS